MDVTMKLESVTCWCGTPFMVPDRLLDSARNHGHTLYCPHGYVAPGTVESWIGISTDEIERIKPSGCRFIHNRHILIEARMSRQSCYTWLEERQYRRPPKSRCKYCPYQDNSGWRSLRDSPAEWDETVELDGWLREPAQVKRFHGEVYLHPSRVPLAQADLTVELPGPDLFGHECEGMCGV